MSRKCDKCNHWNSLLQIPVLASDASKNVVDDTLLSEIVSINDIINKYNPCKRTKQSFKVFKSSEIPKFWNFGIKNMIKEVKYLKQIPEFHNFGTKKMDQGSSEIPKFWNDIIFKICKNSIISYKKWIKILQKFQNFGKKNLFFEFKWLTYIDKHVQFWARGWFHDFCKRSNSGRVSCQSVESGLELEFEKGVQSLRHHNASKNL